MKIKLNNVIQGSERILDNTWNNRFNQVEINKKLKDNELIVWGNGEQTILTPFDEIILLLIRNFLFSPIWLIEQFYLDNNLNKIEIQKKINQWLTIGLVWKEPDVTGEYLRPTYGLYKLFDSTGNGFPEYEELPFNLLRHTIAEQKVMFDILSGKSEILEKVKALPRPSELGFDPDTKGTMVYSEKYFKIPIAFGQDYIDKLMEAEEKIKKEILENKSITYEMINPEHFRIVQRIGNTGMLRDDYKFHLPDLVIPIPRIDGTPQSIAIEIELTNKGIYNYEETIRRFKDTNKYASVFWMCRDQGVSRNIKEAFKNVKGAGKCKFYITELSIPYPKY